MVQNGLVISHLGVAVIVHLETNEQKIFPLSPKTQVVVGDKVQIQESKIKLLPRRNVLLRSGLKKGTMVVAANLDAMGVCICQEPNTSKIFLEQAIIAASMEKITPFIVVNKGDLVQNQKLFAEISAEYENLIPTFMVSSKSGDGVAHLKSFIAKQGRCIFVGVSGSGKSSLTNYLSPQAELATGALSNLKGTHTTSTSSLHFLPDGSELIDSPGVRNFAPVNISPDNLAHYFTGFAPILASPCKFRDCRHVHEPECSIKKAVENKWLSTARYDLYLQMIKALEKL